MMTALIKFLGICCLPLAIALPGQTPSPFSDWKLANAVVADTDDHDGDSIPAIMEYFNGTSPARRDPLVAPQIRIVDGEVTLRIAHDPLVSDVTASLQQLTSGGVWQKRNIIPHHDGQSSRYRLNGAADPLGLFRLSIEPGAGGHILAGADISALTKIEERGGVFRKDGIAGDAIKILRNEGMNMFRLRLFVNPNGSGVVVNSLDYSLELAARIKAAGCGLMLDLHYSDTWADPGHQTKPAAWAGLSFEQLKAQVESYTAAVIGAFAAQGITPDIVQIGNEVTNGMLWPDGQLYIGNTTQQWIQFTDLLKAGIRGARAAVPPGHVMKILIHFDRGADWGATQWFFDRMNQYKVEYDAIGLSYYPWWHGTLADVATTFRLGSRRFKKPMLIVETAYPHKFADYWTAQPNMAWPISAAGQAAFLQDLANVVRANAGAYGMGVFYWYPEAIVVPGLNIWNGGATALFDSSGEVHLGASRLLPVP